MSVTARIRAVARWRGAEGVPKPGLLPAMLRRRTSPLTRSVAEVLDRLGGDDGLEIGTVPLVLGSALGELVTTLKLLEMMHEGDGALSPTRFHNSVHNTATGYVSIASGNRGFATAVAAGRETVAAALWEGLGAIHAGAPEVAVVLADEPPPAPLPGAGSYEALAVGFHLAAPERGSGHLHLDAPRLRSLPTVLFPEQPLAANPCAPAWALANAVLARQPGPVALAFVDGGEPGWSIVLAEDR